MPIILLCQGYYIFDVAAATGMSPASRNLLSFKNSPALLLIVIHIPDGPGTRNRIHCLITSRTDCFSFIPVVQRIYNENLIKHRAHETP